MWNATFEDAPPLSGDAPEVHFELATAESSRWVWVKFVSTNGGVWFASLRAGRLAESQKLGTPDGRHFFIIAGGVCYIVDAETKALTTTLDGSAFDDLLPISGTASIAIADCKTVAVVSSEGRVWTAPRIAWDGIRLVSATQTEVTGVAETGHGPSDERFFTINLIERSVQGGHVSDFTQMESARSATARFKVNWYFEITSRGVFLGGDLQSGEVRVGDRVASSLRPLTVDAVEFADHVSTGKFEICLRFRENPSKAELEEAFPVGEILVIER